MTMKTIGIYGLTHELLGHDWDYWLLTIVILWYLSGIHGDFAPVVYRVYLPLYWDGCPADLRMIAPGVQLHIIAPEYHGMVTFVLAGLWPVWHWSDSSKALMPYQPAGGSFSSDGPFKVSGCQWWFLLLFCTSSSTLQVSSFKAWSHVPSARKPRPACLRHGQIIGLWHQSLCFLATKSGYGQVKDMNVSENIENTV